MMISDKGALAVDKKSLMRLRPFQLNSTKVSVIIWYEFKNVYKDKSDTKDELCGKIKIAF